ncbi:uncharacterized protein JCM6883_001170 [Sporobolomyces salmoneus]|uniref:uncharacterized protein n=1 Tax=Sporobolomyces salmoneus TaxID=183962 RepID=UPI0031721C56
MTTPLERSYLILITLYDPSLCPSSLISPLLPQTPFRLPRPLDSRLEQTIDQLVLPPTRRNFWKLELPKSRELDTENPSTLSQAAVSTTSSPSTDPGTAFQSTSNRIWSQHFNLSSPPLATVQTSQLWTPSQPLPSSNTPSPSPSLAPSSGSNPILDFRFGSLEIDWIKMSDPEPSSGTTSLYWGSIHLYREYGIPSTYESSLEDKQSAKQSDDGTTLGLISVPGVLNAAAILKFLAGSGENEGGIRLKEDIEQVRMLRDSTPARSLVLIKFRQVEKAREFRRQFNGKKYYDSKDSELCHVVPISSILLKPTSLPPFTFPQTPSPSLNPPTSTKPGSKTKPSASETAMRGTEIPTCPICLERLDSKATGLVQIQCQHSYHCNCLLRWGDSRCPVCRATNLKPSSHSSTNSTTEEEGTEASNCTVCTSPSNLWICIICGNVGCGRYQGGHAHSHYTETGHSYSLELQTGRIWSYTDDEYVHRLLRLPSSTLSSTSHPVSTSRLIELPSLASHHNPEDLSSKIGSSYSHGGPDRSAEEEQDKLERIAIEYSGLLQSNLEQQREWFEDELGREKELRKGWEVRVGELESALERERKENERLRKEERIVRGEKESELGKMGERLEGLERELKRTMEERKKERLDAVRMRKSIERELEQEKSVTLSLSQNLGSMRSEVEERKRETDQVRSEMEELKEQVNDLMAALTMRERIEQEPEGSELRGATIGVAPTGAAEGEGGKTPSQVLSEKRKKKTKKKK